MPQIVNYQGRVTVGGTNFNGTGQFKFALVDNGGSVLWSNSAIVSGQPGAHVALPVANGIYSVFLGDTVMSNMAAIPASVFANSDVRLRIWFNNGVLGFQQLTPDQRIGAVGYAIMAGSVPDGAITSNKLAAGAVTGVAIANGAVGTAQLGTGAVTGTNIATGAVGSPQLAANAITTDKIASGAVTGTQLANGAVGPAGLARKYDADRFDILNADLTSFPTTVETTLPFHFTFATAPVVAFGAEAPNGLPPTGITLGLQSKTTTNFGLKISGLTKLTSDVLSFNTEQVNEQGTTQIATTEAAMQHVNGNPAVAYVESGTLYFRVANDASGLSWGLPFQLDASVSAGAQLDFEIIGGNPAVAYTTSSGALKFLRASNANGSAWPLATTILATGVSGRPLLTQAAGNPLVATQNTTTNKLRLHRATNAAGTGWGLIGDLNATTGVRPGHADLTVVNGNPALVFSVANASDDADLMYLRATLADATAWPAAGVAVQADAGNTKQIGTNPQFLSVEGNPGVVYGIAPFLSTSIGFPPTTTTSGGQVVFARAADVNGTSWGSAVTMLRGVPGIYNQPGNPYAAPPYPATRRVDVQGLAGQQIGVGIIAGVPTVVAYREVAEPRYPQFPSGAPPIGYTPLLRLAICEATDANGGSWRTVAEFSAGSTPAELRSLQPLGSAMSWVECAGGGLRFMTREGIDPPVNRGFPAPQRPSARGQGALQALTRADGWPMAFAFDSAEGSLKAVRSVDQYGSAWQTPTVLTSANEGRGASVAMLPTGPGVTFLDSSAGSLRFSGGFGAATIEEGGGGLIHGDASSLGTVEGFPAVAYAAANYGALRFARATSNDGLNWGAPGTLVTGSTLGYDCQLLIVGGNPAIFYRHGSTLRFIRAANPGGTLWGSPVTILTDANLKLGARATLIGGSPAIAYATTISGNFTVRFARATAADGSAWAAPTTVLSATGAAEFNGLALAEFNGTPALAAHNTLTGELRFASTTVLAGTSGWTSELLDPAAGTAGDEFHGRRVELLPFAKPVVLYYATTGVGAARDLRMARCVDTDGSVWSPPETVVEPDDVGSHLSAAATNGGQVEVASYNVTRQRLTRLRSPNEGATWSAPVATAAFAKGEHFSAALAGGNPAVAFCDGANRELRIARASDAGGATWSGSTLITAKLNALTPGAGPGLFPSMTTVNSALAVSYYDADTGDLYYVRATNANGAFWNAPVAVATTGDVGGYTSMTVVNGRPAIAYHHFTNGTLHYVRANNADGTSWGAPVTVDTTTDSGQFNNLIVLNGVPTITYYEAGTGALKFVRANNADGTTWAAPQTIDGASTSADMGRFVKVGIIAGLPSAVYWDASGKDLRYARATDATGSTWNVKTLDSDADTGFFPAITPVGNLPAIFHCRVNELSEGIFTTVKFVLPTKPFAVSWTAVEP